MYKINFCKSNDLKNLMEFIGNNWSENHILAKDENFFKWQHQKKINKIFNFVIAKKNKEIIGCHGFVCHSQFSKKLKKNDTIWMINWFALKGIPNPGIDLIFFPINNLKYKKLGTIGCNKKAKNLYKNLGFNVGYMKHYFLLNSNIKKFSIAKFNKKLKKTTKTHKSNKIIKSLKSKLNLKIFGKDLDNLINKFGKDEQFFNERYLNHPYYKYKICQIIEFKKILGFIVIRTCKLKNKKALRIVDFFGFEEALENIKFALHKLLIKENAEYIDIYEYGLNNRIMKNSGLTKNNFKDEIVIPNYFEPFVKKNIKLSWAIKNINSEITPMFKGDCDQDRPNNIFNKF